MNRISIINDEVSDNLDEVVKFLHKQKLKYVEIRSIGKKNILDIPEWDLKKYGDSLRKNNISVSCIASPILKWLPKEHNILKERNGSKFDSFYFKGIDNNFEKAFEVANIFNAKYIRIFSFLKYNNFNIKHLEIPMARLKVLAEEHNKVLLMENEPACNLNSIKDLELFVRLYGNNRLKLLIDIGNLYKNDDCLSEEELEKIKDFIEYVHIKDYSFSSKNYVPLGEGDINYKRYLSWFRTNFSNRLFYSLETHTGEKKRKKDSELSVKSLKKLINQKRVAYGIIGCGRIFKKHIEAIRVSDKSELIGVFDIDRVKTKKEARKNDCKSYSNVEELIRDADIVNICTPHYTHLELIKKVVKHGKKCLCEKPGGINEQRIDKIIGSKKYKDNVFIVYQNRFNKPIVKFDNMVKKSRLGNLLYVFGNVRWFRDPGYYKGSWQGKKRLEGGMLFNQGIHILDIMMKYFDQKAETKILGAYKDKIYHKNIDTEDIFLAQFKNKNTIFNLEITVSASPCNFGSSLLFIFKNGRARVSGMSLNESLSIHLPGGKSLDFNYSEKNQDVYGYGHKVLINKMSEFVLTGKRDKNLMDFKEAMERVKLINKLYKVAQKK